MGISFSDNLLDRVGGNGVALTAFNRGASVTGNHIRYPGENGVVLVGSTIWVDGRSAEQPRFNTVSSNIIHHVGLYTKQACAIFIATSCQNIFARNILFHGPRVRPFFFIPSSSQWRRKGQAVAVGGIERERERSGGRGLLAADQVHVFGVRSTSCSNSENFSGAHQPE